MKKREVRMFPITELRASEDGKTLTGHAAIFDRWTQIGDPEWGFQECVRRGCFRDDIESGADIRCLMNHDVNFLLGRTTSKTLRCSEDEAGLRFDVDLPNTQLGRDVKELVARGDLSGCSFSFDVTNERWVEEKGDDGQLTLKRELLACKLYDVGPVTFPAYEQTDVAVRSLIESHAPKNSASEALDDIARQLRALHIAAEIEFSR